MKRSTIVFLFLLSTLLSKPASAQVFLTASLDGSQSVPAAVSNGTGTAWAVLNVSGGSLTYRVTYANLDSTFTAAHFHLGAAGTNGPVEEGITSSFTGNTASGIWTNIPDSLISALMKGDIYINIHSKKYPGGEIRGQLKVAPDLGISMSLDGAQDVPALSVTGSGTGWAFFKPDSNVLVYRVTVAGLTSNVTGSHFHYGAAGTNGPVVFPFSMTDSTATGEWAFPDSMWAALLTNNLYVNVHTSYNPGGEIRGMFMLEPTAKIFLKAALNGSNSVPASTTNGTGTAWAVLNMLPPTPLGASSYPAPQLTYRVTYADLDSTFTAAHFHLGVAGANGAVVMPISTFSGNTAQGEWASLPDSIIDALMSGNIYVNVHSKAYPAGEIRGELKRADGIPFSISLSSDQSSPSISTNGTGTGWAVLDTTGSDLKYNITVASLSSALTAAHFHLGSAGSNGPVVESLSYTDSTASGIWSSVPDTLLPDLLGEMLYANFHTTDHPAGEIRGQLVLDDGTILTAVREAQNNVPSRFQLAQNYPNPFNPLTIISYVLPEKAQVRLDVYNILGQRVTTLVDGAQQAGTHFVKFDGSRLASGVYFYRLSNNGNAFLTKKMILLK